MAQPATTSSSTESTALALPGQAGDPIEIPRLKAVLRHALPRLAEGVVAPVAVFYAGFALLGLTGALVAAVLWVYGGIALRVARRQGVPGVLMLAAVGVTVRAGLAAATDSAVLFFLQPTLGTVLVSMAFLASVGLRRPLALKLAVDMVPMPDAFVRHARVRRFFLRISLLWSLVLMTNAVLSVWMLFHQSLSTFLWLRTSLVTALGAAAVCVSVLGFRRVLRHVNEVHQTA